MKTDFINLSRELQTLGYSNLYIRNALKEIVLANLLSFIYNHRGYQQWIFTGGTCLRFCHGLDRLSEDLDLDTEDKIDVDVLAEDLEKFFRSTMRMIDLAITVKDKSPRIYLKFGGLKVLQLATDQESDLLFVKVEINDQAISVYDSEIKAINKFNKNLLVRCYTLPSLFSGKIHALLTRSYFKGKQNEITVKGRDYYDLFWFLNKGVIPNLLRLRAMLAKNSPLVIEDGHRLKEELLNRVRVVHTTDLLSDLQPFIQDQDYLNRILEHYQPVVMDLINQAKWESTSK